MLEIRTRRGRLEQRSGTALPEGRLGKLANPSLGFAVLPHHRI